MGKRRYLPTAVGLAVTAEDGLCLAVTARSPKDYRSGGGAAVLSGAEVSPQITTCLVGWLGGKLEKDEWLGRGGGQAGPYDQP